MKDSKELARKEVYGLLREEQLWTLLERNSKTLAPGNSGKCFNHSAV